MARIVRQDVKRISQLRKRRKNFRVATVVITLAVLLGIGSFVFGSESFEIKDVKIVGAETVSEENVAEIVNSQIEGSYLFAIPKKNALVYPRLSIKKKIGERFIRIGEVKTNLESLNKLEVTLTERQEKYVWCSGSEEARCFYADEAGLIFKDAPILEDGAFLKLVSKVPAVEENYYGLYAMDKNLFKKIISIIDEVEGPSISIVRVELEDSGDIILTTNKNWEILIAGSTELERLIRNLNLALASDALKAEAIEARGGLEYLDLRFGNKVFFKFKN